MNSVIFSLLMVARHLHFITYTDVFSISCSIPAVQAAYGVSFTTII